MSPWDTINTAPMDGTHFLAYQDGWHFDCWWHFFPADKVYDWQDAWDSDPNPTHWMPLPAPPVKP